MITLFAFFVALANKRRTEPCSRPPTTRPFADWVSDQPVHIYVLSALCFGVDILRITCSQTHSLCIQLF